MTAYSSDLRDESLDGQRVVVGGIVTGVRTVITKAKATMAIVTMEDLQGTIEVVVFPRLYEQTAGTWREGEILLVAGGSTTGARTSRCWPTSRSTGTRRSAAGPGGVRAPGRGGRSRRRAPRAGGPGGNGNGHGDAASVARIGTGRWSAGRTGRRSGRPRSAPVAGRRSRPRRPIPFVSPRRGGGAGGADGAGRRRLPPIAPAEPVSTYPRDRPAPPRARTRTTSRRVPDEARARIVADATRRRPGRRRPGHGPPRPVRRAAPPPDRVVGAMEAFKARAARPPGRDPGRHPRPGAGGGAALPMELRRGVAYDAELLAEVRRRLGDGLVDLRLRLTAGGQALAG